MLEILRNQSYNKRIKKINQTENEFKLNYYKSYINYIK